MSDEQLRDLEREAEAAGWVAAEHVARQLSDLFSPWHGPQPVSGADILRVVQDAVAYPTDVLRRAGVPTAARDRVTMRRYPDDVYDLTPRSLATVHPQLPEMVAEWERDRARGGVT